MNGLYIPVAWIYEQIKKNPGRHASSWNYLLDLWNKKLLKDMDDEKTDPNDYIRMHKDQTAAQKFWRNE